MNAFKAALFCALFLSIPALAQTSPSGAYTGFGSPAFKCTAPCTYLDLSRSPYWATTAQAGLSANSWLQQPPPNPGGGGSPGGTTQAVQLNFNGSFGGDVNTLAENTATHTTTAANLITALPRVDARASQFAGGADPTGTNDSTAAFQAAINFAVAQEAYGVGGNPSVYCAPGNYKINGTLTMPGYINFVGDGTTTCDLIETNATANLMTITWSDIGATAHGSLRNVTLEGSGQTTTGTLLEVDNAPGYTIDNVELFNNGGRGLQLNGHSERFSSHNLKIDQVRWPIIMPADENESYFVNTQITYPGQVASGYCYSINCVNGVAPGANQGAGGTATPISPDTHAAIYVDVADNFRFLGGSIKPLGYMAGIQDFNSNVGTISNMYFEGLFAAPWASDSPSIEVGGAAPRTTLSSGITGTALIAPVTSTDWQPQFYGDASSVPTNPDDGAVYILMPADYLSGSTAASADVPGVQRGQFEKVKIDGFAGDGNLHIATRNLGGSTAPAGTAWPSGTVVEEAPQTYGGFGAVTISSDHFFSQEPASSGYAKNCNQLGTLTCGEIIAGFEPDGYWIDPTGGFNSNLLANVILNGDEMFYSGSDPYVGQIATHDNNSITIEGYSPSQNLESAEVVTSPYKYSINASVGGSDITAPTYANGRTAETKVSNASDHSVWWAAAGIYSGERAVSGQGPFGGNSFMQGKQYVNQYCFFDTPGNGTQPLHRFCFNGGPGNTANAGYEYDTWNGSGWTPGVNDALLLDNLGIAMVPGKVNALSMYSEGLATSGQNYDSLPIVFQSEIWNGSASAGCHVHTWLDANDVFQYKLQGGDDPACKAATVNLPTGSTTNNLGGVLPVVGIVGASTAGHIAVLDGHGNVEDGGAVPAGSTIAATAPIQATTSGGTTTISCPTCGSGGGGMYTANVKDYGAKGDGSTDDGTAIQNATAAATASCGTVYFPAGTYMHAATLTKPRCVVWKGVSTNGTTISYTGTGVAYVEGDTTVNASLSHAGGVQDLTFNGPVANGASGSTIGVYFGGDPAGTISSASNLDDNTHWDNVVVQNFALGAKAGNNFFLASFIRAVFVNNGAHFLYPSGLTNSGERISFKDSAFVQSSTGSAISINSPLAEFDFDATSFDYNDQSAADFTCTSGGMYVYISHSHFEKTHGEFIDIPSTCGMNMDISDSYMLENGQNVTPVTQPDLIQFQAGNAGNLSLTIRGTSVYSNDPVTAFIVTAANVSKQIELDGLQWGGLTSANLPVAVNDNGNNNGLTITSTNGLASFPARIANIQITTAADSLAPNTCDATATAVTMTGLTTTSTVSFTYATDPTSVVGWGPSGSMTIKPWVTANTLNYRLCNLTGASLSASPITLNVSGR